MENDRSTSWKTLSSNKVHSSPWIEVSEHEVITPGHNKAKYSTVHFKNFAIGILPIDKNGNTWIVGQHRYPIGRFSWEIPEGGGPLDIPPLESAKRELKEETGITAHRWDLMQEMKMSNSATDEHAYLYLARDLEFGEPEPEEDEELTLKKLPFEELYQMVLNGSIHDSLTVTSVLRARCTYLAP